MKCLVFSDSHGSSYGMLKALSMHTDAEVVFFLGDGLSDADSVEYSDRMSGHVRAWFAVRGNCDFRNLFQNREVEKLASVNLRNKKIVITHGDLYGAKYGMQGLSRLCENENADIVLFGHPHTPYEEYVSGEKPHYLFNPGSVGSSSFSFGIITLTENSVLFSHGTVI